MKVPFNKPFLTGAELIYIKDAINNGHLSGNGKYTRMCQRHFGNISGVKKALLTTSCTDALEMAAILCDIQKGNEVIVPSFTFPSTANAFILRGANVVFVDSRPDHPGMDECKIEELITPLTKVIVPVHYAGVACNMEVIMNLANKYNLLVVEDAAQAIESYYTGTYGGEKALGSIGHFGCFSFHETKNIQCGEGGMIFVNDELFVKRSEIIWEKGTNRTEFFRGEVNKYGWVDIGSSFLPSEITAAFLWAQVEQLNQIQSRRKEIWNHYYEHLKTYEKKGYFTLPKIPDYATNNAHLFYLVCNSLIERDNLIEHLKKKGALAVFHYQSLHKSPFYSDRHDGRSLPNSDRYSDRLVRLPIFYDLQDDEAEYICEQIITFFR